MGAGRPRKEINFVEFEKLCALQATQQEIADWFAIDTDTLDRRIKEHYECKFSEIFNQKRGRGKIALRRMQMQAAEKGNTTMLIWLGKQYLKQTDKNEYHQTAKIEVNIDRDDSEL